MLVPDVLWVLLTAIYLLMLLFFFAVGTNLLYMVILACTRPPRHTDPPSLTDLPTVTVQLPIFNELYVTERIIDAACKLDWPRELLDIQVLDDSTDETRFIASRMVRQY